MSELPATANFEKAKCHCSRDGWVCFLYLAVTAIVNLGALIVVPKFATPENARETLPYYILPCLWGAYLSFMYRKTSLRWVAYVNIPPSLLWLLAAIGDV